MTLARISYNKRVSFINRFAVFSLSLSLSVRRYGSTVTFLRREGYRPNEHTRTHTHAHARIDPHTQTHAIRQVKMSRCLFETGSVYLCRRTRQYMSSVPNCVCVCVYVYVCVYLCLCACMYVCVYMTTPVRARACVYGRSYKYKSAHVCTCVVNTFEALSY